ncbi:type II secretion system minor pseudopilin GspK [Simiduia sp. 21SJ11W-1]|uniref:type II secretion system minor pseudopilin GspK n=1 Tax=Simiduia sp. 21SJ11W-1 TaxID=2909669 RepID=UPI00209FD788|nr:type II secretion system minor pseudopilin GspK [Simiduia sp. 21SJ11W-1]UTA47879.1 type II secretion system minor pseudopilin GspK [Simiduia sp. 21SJ11W-1]
MRVRQRGAVLILALLIVALVATLAVNYASQMTLVQARAENRLYGAQQEIYADSMIDMAARLLKEDADNSQLDHLYEDWAFPGGASYPVEGGMVQASLTDAQAVFNINSLGTALQNNANPNDPSRFTEPQRRFIRFLQTFDGNQNGLGQKDARAEAEDPDAPPPLVIDLNLAVMITEALVDWLDADDQPTGYGGAESLQYQQTGATWVPPNGPMESVEELKLVQHITPEIFEAIRPHVTVLPQADAPLNINTIQDLRIVQSLNGADQMTPLNAQDLSDFGDWRGDAGFSTVDDLINQADFQALVTGAAMETTGLSVSTEFFWLNIEVSLAEKVINRRMLLHRKGGDIKVLARFASGQQTAIQVLGTQQDADARDDNERDQGRGRDGRRDDNSDNKRRNP